MPYAELVNGVTIELIPFERRMENGFVPYEAIEEAGESSNTHPSGGGLSITERLTHAVGPAPGVYSGTLYAPMQGPGTDANGVARWQAPPAKS